MIPLTIGTQVDDPGRPAVIDGSRFNRHTFWCGQSGSGKTYALGVVLEQLLLETELPIAVLDPNADYTKLDITRAGADGDGVARLRERDIRILHSSTSAEPRLHTRYLDLSGRAQAAIARLDPIRDAEEYNFLLHIERNVGGAHPDTLLASLIGSEDATRHQLGLRIDNLEILDWTLWSRGPSTSLDILDARPRLTVFDVGGFAHMTEPQAAALSVIEHLWDRRLEHKPVLIVLDEAHNFCPAEPRNSVEAELTERLIQIAAEGRKFGLWLFVSTQRPTKIHPNVLSQCDNLGLMRMNSPRDLAELADVFGFVPEEQLVRAAAFRQGQALFAGGFSREAQIVQLSERLTLEGGSDLSIKAAGG